MYSAEYQIDFQIIMTYFNPHHITMYIILIVDNDVIGNVRIRL